MDSIEKLQWSALEYEERERSNDWFWGLGVIVVAVAITSIIYSNYFFAVLVILGGAMLGFFAVKKPAVILYELNDKGLQAGTRLFPYENISAFWVRKELNPSLFIKAERFFMPILSVPIHEDSATQIREVFLAKNIAEVEMKEPTSERIIDSLGF